MRRSVGFTLIELLLATVLTSLLMLGVLAVITRVSAPVQADAEVITRVADDGLPACIQLIRADLSTARTIEMSDVGIEMFNHGAVDPATHERSQLPAEVRYFIEMIDNRPWLMREQRVLAGPDTQSLRVEAVWAGIIRIELLPPAPLTVLSPGTAQQSDADPDALQRPADVRWLLRLWEDDTQAPTIEHAIVLPRRLAG